MIFKYIISSKSVDQFFSNAAHKQGNGVDLITFTAIAHHGNFHDLCKIELVHELV